MPVLTTQDPITTNTTASFNVDCKPCVVNIRNAGAGPATAKILAGSYNIQAEYSPDKVIAAGAVAQQAIAEPYQAVSVVTTSNTGSLIIEVTVGDN